jgi:hypothetical protein
MIIEKRSMNWLPKASAFDYAQQQQKRRRNMAQTFLAQQQNTASLLGSVGTTSSKSMVEQTINNAVERIRAGGGGRKV